MTPLLSRVLIAAAAGLLTLGATALSGGAAAAGQPAPTASATGVLAQRVCGDPLPGQATCLALREPVAKRALVRTHAPSLVPAGYAPADLRLAYNLPSGTAGSGQTLAIIDAYDDPSAEADLAVYRSQYGVSACTTANGCFRKVNQSGTATPLPAADARWAGEISLDLDMVSAICPNCHILLVEANSTYLTDLGTGVNRAVSMGAKFVSNSYGGAESTSDTGYDTSYFNHPGVAITASTGDFDYGAMYPATSSYVTAVGGTSLTTSANSRGWSESVWNTTSYTKGTGSGCSDYLVQPGFQYSTSTGCKYRAEADVSAVADPATGVAVYQSYGGYGWSVFGGTSASAPIVAGVYALAGTPSAGRLVNYYPYAHTVNLNDVTVGMNGNCGAPLCTAGSGWDGPTGLGTPNGVTAFTPGPLITLQSPGPQSAFYGYQVPVQIHAWDADPSKTISYSAGGLPPGLSINPSTGLISGNPTLCTPVTFGFSSMVSVSDGQNGALIGIAWTMYSYSPCPH